MRRAFTLVELLVVVAIIAILAGLTLGALSSARESARERKTRATIAKLNRIVMERWESYATRRLQLTLTQPPANASPAEQVAWTRANRLKTLYARRDLMRMEMPERRQDILSLSMTGLPEPAIHRSLRSWMQEMEQRASFREYKNIEAEVFYAWVTMVRPDNRGSFAGSDARELMGELDIGDTDGDTALEFLDGWGRPIFFLRWPVAFLDSDLQSPGNAAWCAENHDPFDVFHLQENAFQVYPLIYSPGRDGVYGVDVQAGIDYGASAVVDPYAHHVGAPIENGGHFDNLTNHRMAP